MHASPRSRRGGEGPRDRRGTRGSSDAHRARTAFQLAASRCRDWDRFIVGFDSLPLAFRATELVRRSQRSGTKRVSGDPSLLEREELFGVVNQTSLPPSPER